MEIVEEMIPATSIQEKPSEMTSLICKKNMTQEISGSS